jgi:hypothetical protein
VEMGDTSELIKGMIIPRIMQY